MKELSDFDFASVPSLNKTKVVELAKCSYIPSHTNVVMMGPPGVGKTHVAISLTLNACRFNVPAKLASFIVKRLKGSVGREPWRF